MINLPKKERKKKVEKLVAERKYNLEKIKELTVKRKAYIAKEMEKEGTLTFSQEILEVLKKQAKAQGISLD